VTGGLIVREGLAKQLEMPAKQAFQRQYANLEERRGGALGSVLLICSDAHCGDADKVRKSATENRLKQPVANQYRMVTLSASTLQPQ